MDCRECKYKGTEICKRCASTDRFEQMSVLDAYEMGKRDGALLIKQIVLHALRGDIDKMIDKIPKGWL